MKHHFLMVGTEPTGTNKVADFGAVVIDRHGNVVAELAALVRGIFNKPRKHTLFWNDSIGALWAKAKLTARYDNYHAMLKDGRRQYMTVQAINAWLQKAAQTQWAQNKKYLEYVLQAHAFNEPRPSRTMSYKTTAEIMAGFVQGHPVIAEPHTAYEDALYFEAPILVELLKRRSTKWLLQPRRGITWRDVQVKDHFQAKRGRK